MMYISTRGGDERVSSAQAIAQGIAKNGGLFVPEELPEISEAEITELIGMSYPERAAYVLSKFLTDYTEQELLGYAERSYSAERFPGEGGAAPVHTLSDKISVLELFHGPTCAFKDMALQIMPHLLSGALEKTGVKGDAFILTATSGDTGKAALDGYHDVPRVRIMVFYPVYGVSRVQKLQMSTQEGENVMVCPVKGNFDDTQTGVKRIFTDPEANKYLAERGYFFSSANSINWGRLAPQIVYYVSAYCDMIASGRLKLGEQLDVSVPTGNFGDIFAAYIAKRCGLPLGRLVCASNKNRILTDFLATGTYDRNRDFYTTMSPSMDILISSNLERLLWFIAGADATRGFMESLTSGGSYTVPADTLADARRDFYGASCNEEQTAECIRSTYEKYGYLIDPHTAVGLYCAETYIGEEKPQNKLLCVSTASPYKFASNVYPALTGKKLDDEFECIDETARLTGVTPPAPLSELRSKTVRFDPDKYSMPEEMLDCVKRFADK